MTPMTRDALALLPIERFRSHGRLVVTLRGEDAPTA